MPNVTITTQRQIEAIRARWGEHEIRAREWRVGITRDVNPNAYAYIMQFRSTEPNEPWTRPCYAPPAPVPVALP
jgi:hypothetical protein